MGVRAAGEEEREICRFAKALREYYHGFTGLTRDIPRLWVAKRELELIITEA